MNKFFIYKNRAYQRYKFLFLLEYKETPVTESKVAKEEKFAREILSNNLTY